MTLRALQVGSLDYLIYRKVYIGWAQLDLCAPRSNTTPSKLYPILDRSRIIFSL